MRICLINNRFSSHVRSGAERIIADLAIYLGERGDDVTIIEANQAYSKLIALPLWRRFLYHTFSIFHLRSYWRLRHKIKKGNFDLIWTHNLTGFGLLAFRALGRARKIHTMHDIQLLHPSGLLMYGCEQSIDSPLVKIYQFLVKLVFPRDALVLFPSSWLESLYLERGFFKDNLRLVIKNPIEGKPLAHRSSSLFTFLYLGQIEEHKGVALLLEAFKKISLPCRLLIGGDGKLLSNLKRKYRDSRISFIGGFEDPYAYLNQADCVVIPSICYENLPTVALEAARAETPVIGSRLGGVGESIGNSELLFEPTVEDLTRLMRWALTNPEKLQTLAAAARQKLSIPTLEKYWQTIKKTVS